MNEMSVYVCVVVSAEKHVTFMLDIDLSINVSSMDWALRRGGDGVATEF